MEIITEDTKTSCMICKRKRCSHQIPTVSTEENLSLPINQRKPSFQNIRLSKYKSCFLRLGELKDEINKEELNKLYPFKNFKSVKVGNACTILGKGTFGNVFLSKNTEDGKFYSIKQVSKNKLAQDGSDLVFENELQIHPRLNHEHIIKFFNYYETEDSYYLILEYASKGSLFDLLRSTNCTGIPEKEAFKYFIQITSAVFFLHENKLIHRDIKPENILLDENNKAKLSDFGWCVQLTLENRNSFCGTYEYMAPEMISETPYNFSVDIWALGVLLFELLHGYSPFRANSNRDDYYLEVFQNISKSSFKIEKELSENCVDLLKSNIII
jgi:serine/threonine protein kinase